MAPGENEFDSPGLEWDNPSIQLPDPAPVSHTQVISWPAQGHSHRLYLGCPAHWGLSSWLSSIPIFACFGLQNAFLSLRWEISNSPSATPKTLGSPGSPTPDCSLQQSLDLRVGLGKAPLTGLAKLQPRSILKVPVSGDLTAVDHISQKPRGTGLFGEGGVCLWRAFGTAGLTASEDFVALVSHKPLGHWVPFRCPQVLGLRAVSWSRPGK